MKKRYTKNIHRYRFVENIMDLMNELMFIVILMNMIGMHIQIIY